MLGSWGQVRQWQGKYFSININKISSRKFIFWRVGARALTRLPFFPSQEPNQLMTMYSSALHLPSKSRAEKRKRRLVVVPKKRGLRSLTALGFFALFLSTLSLFTLVIDINDLHFNDPNFNLTGLWQPAAADGWRPSSEPRIKWSPPIKTNGYLSVRCNGGLNQQRGAICNAVVAARVMNATLVLPNLSANDFWHDHSVFSGIYDVEHFIKSLRNDVHVVESLPEIQSFERTDTISTFKINPPRDAPLSWYRTEALEMLILHGAIHLTPFSHRMAEEIYEPELQRLRCRVNYHALRFKPHIMQQSSAIVQKLHAEGHFMAIHLRFEMDMIAFAGCFDIFTPEEQKILTEYRKNNFKEKVLDSNRSRRIGKCPLTPEEVGLVLNAMGFDNTTIIYLASGDLFGGDRFMKPLRKLFPRLVTHDTIPGLENLGNNSHTLSGSAIDYMVCLNADIFMPTYDGPSNFANNVIGHRLYNGFGTVIQPNRKALGHIFTDRSQGRITSSNFDQQVRRVMAQTKFGGPRQRIPPEWFFTNSWPECFCQLPAKDPSHRCPSRIVGSSGEEARTKIS